MDDSFSQWRGEEKSPAKYSKNKRDSSIILSDSEDDLFASNTGNDPRKHVIESSEYSDTDNDTNDFQTSRNSRKAESQERRSTQESRADPEDEWKSSDEEARFSHTPVDLDDSSSSLDMSVARKKHVKKRNVLDDSESDATRQINKQNGENHSDSEASDNDDIYKDTSHSHKENDSSGLYAVHNKNGTGSSSTAAVSAVKKNRIKKILDDSEDRITDHSGRRNKHSLGTSTNPDISNDEQSITYPSGRRDKQSLSTSADPDISYDSESFETSDNSYTEDEDYIIDENTDLGPHSNSKEKAVGMPSVKKSIQFDKNDPRSEKADRSWQTISDTSVTEYTRKNTAPIHQRVDLTSGTDASSSVSLNVDSDDDIVVRRLVQKEIGVGNIDPFVAQKRAILTCNIEQVQNQLARSKMLLHTANISMLPDKGEKLRRSVNAHEAELRKLSAELESLPKIDTPKPQSIKSESISPIPTLRWENLPQTLEVKPLGRKAQATQEREQALTVERIADLHGSLNARPGEDERAEDPKGLKVCLMPHQQHALAWLLWREKQKPHGGILADDMGLGKTLTMISLIMMTLTKQDSDEESANSDDEWVHRKKTIRPKGGTLVVCPASLIAQWEAEINKRVKRGLLSVELFHGTNRENVPKRLAKNDVVITTYNLLSREYKDDSILYKINWKRVILDEAHVVRNHKSQASQAVCNLFARYRWALTGTPIQNKELDLYALLKYLKCSPFDDLRVWKRWVDNKNAQGHERLATVMKTLMLRRTKQELQAKGGLGSLPDKNLDEIKIKLDPEEQLVYEKILVFSRTLFAQFLHQRAEKNHVAELYAGKFDAPSFLQRPKDTQFTKVQNQLLARHAGVKAHEILVLLLRLRQVCCHPALIDAMLDQEDLQGNDVVDEGGMNPDVMAGIGALSLEDTENIDPNEIGVDRRVVENLLTTKNPVFDPSRQSSKMRAVLATIQDILDKGDKMVVVSQWTSMLEVVRIHLSSLNGATYDTLSGKVPVKNRQHIVESFNKVGSGPQILLLSLTAGGVGLNLVGGNHLLLLDIHWNPQLEAQAQDRIYRVGQTKSVYIYKFICLDTVEQRIKALQDNKLAIAQNVLTGGGTASAARLTLEDMKTLFSL